MTKCCQCGIEKTDEDFAFKNKSRNIRSSKCRSCHSEYVKRHYQINKQTYVDRARKTSKIYRQRNKKLLVGYLRKCKCADCDEPDIRVLDFDHRSQHNKILDVGKMIANYSWERILTEISKCDVRCANCHRKRTAKQFNSYRQRECGGMAYTAVSKTAPKG